MSLPFSAGQTAVITGAALGIGRATARRLAKFGLRIVMIDQASPALTAAAADVAAMVGAENVLASPTDVTDASGMIELAKVVEHRFGAPSLLMNNAATRVGGGVAAPTADWRKAFDVNFWGVMNGVNAFLPSMLAPQKPGFIVNVGSKQGITNPPGNAACNATKAALKFYTESLQHDLRSRSACSVSAHLLVPGGPRRARTRTSRVHGCPNRSSNECLNAWRPAASTSCAPTTRSARRWTSSASCGRQRTSPPTDRHCHAGMAGTAKNSRRSINEVVGAYQPRPTSALTHLRP